jgi:hypothetical protein
MSAKRLLKWLGSAARAVAAQAMMALSAAFLLVAAAAAAAAGVPVPLAPQAAKAEPALAPGPRSQIIGPVPARPSWALSEVSASVSYLDYCKKTGRRRHSIG